MKTGFIIYLTNKKAKEIRRVIESLYAVKQLGKQPTAVV
jgi:ribosomal protein L17